VRLLWLLPPFLFQVFEVRARLVLGFYLFLDNLLPFLLSPGEGGGVAHGAHIGGFLAGLAVAWVIDRARIEGPPEERRVAEAAAAPATGAVLHEALVSRRLAAAAEAYFALPVGETRGALTAMETLQLASWLRDRGRTDDALLVLRRTIRDVHDAPFLAEVYALAGFILLDDRGDATAAYQYLLTALELHPDAKTAAEVRRALAQIEGMQPPHLGRSPRPRTF
jgi:tetratricopeptide (TPR) repeat protein